MAGLATPWHLAILALIALLLIGPTQLPKLGRSAGETAKEFRQALEAWKQREDMEDEDAS